MDLAAGVSPAGSFRYPTIAVQLVEPGVRIHLQNTVEARKMTLRVDSFSVRAVGEPHGRCQPGPGVAVITNVRPQPPGLRLLIAR